MNKSNGENTGPQRYVDPKTNEAYVLIPAETYERLRSLLGEVEEINPRDLYPALHRAMRHEGWDDPKMDDYNQYG